MELAAGPPPLDLAFDVNGGRSRATSPKPGTPPVNSIAAMSFMSILIKHCVFRLRTEHYGTA